MAGESGATDSGEQEFMSAEGGPISDISESEIEYGELLGSGAFGKVYRGTWRGINVAVKVMQADDMETALKAQSEAETMR